MKIYDEINFHSTATQILKEKIIKSKVVAGENQRRNIFELVPPVKVFLFCFS